MIVPEIKVQTRQFRIAFQIVDKACYILDLSIGAVCD